MPAKILVVDDEHDLELLIRQRFRRAIRDGELEFSFAHNGLEALAQIESDVEIAVVLTDINMPHMDGLTFLAKMEEMNLPTKAVVVSAYGDMDNIRTAMNRGAFDFLTKPIDFHDVEITIIKTLEYVNQLRESRRAEEYRIAKEAAEQNYERLRELEALRDSLTSMIVHDLRTPLTSFIGGLESMTVMGDLNEDQSECLDIALTGGYTLLGMINDLLDISKMESGLLQLEYNEIEIMALLQRSVNQVAALASNKNLSLIVEDCPDLPQLKADQEKLERTLTNLLGNAIKFTPTGGTVTAKVDASHEPQMLLFSVIDTGEGIPDTAFERIFDKFGQVETRQSGRKLSTGLGLTFCKMAVEAHNGRIWVESELGQGSKFSFLIPLQPALT
ncbi:MAG: response regulator [Abitibacteriaceae bacterium]|nr:response regulator [Abditibacteriaceae bacterium]